MTQLSKWALAASVLLAPFAMACSPTVVPVKEPDECKYQEVKVSIIASPDINPSRTGTPRPVQVRVYQLAADVRLENSPFEDIWKKDEETLGEDLVKSEELPVYPDTRTDMKFERDDKAQHVAGVALFRNPKGRSWYATFELPPAPSEGTCGQETQCPEGAEGEEGECEAPLPVNPEIYMYLDEYRIEDGVEYADYRPEGRVLERQSTAQAPSKPEEAPAAQPEK